jgi:mitogen-activated protein kinase kinase kinase
MLQHTPTLYTHAERDVDSDEDDGWGDAVVGLESAAPFSALSTAASIGSPPPLGGISGNTPGVGPAASRIRLGRSRNSYSAASVGPSNVSFAALPTPGGGGGGGVGGVGVTPGVGPSPGNGIPAGSTPGRPANANTPRYSDLYSQFVQRYRSGANSHDVDPRSDPDSHFYQRGGGGILADQDSDDDDGPLSHSHLGLGHGHGHGLGLTHGKGMDGLEQRMAGLGLGGAASHTAGAGDVQPEPATVEQRERLEWQTMLASVLGGDVLKGEKTRIAGALASSAEEKNNMHVNVWLGLRSRLHGRAEAEERKRIEERRVRIVDDAIKGVLMFRIPDSSTSTSAPDDPDAPTALNGDGTQPTSVQAQPDLTAALSQVHAVLAKLDAAQALYPNLKAFYIDKPAALGEAFQARCDTLYTWSTVLSSLRKQIALLRKWTGSETLDVTEPNTDPEAPLGGGSGFRNLPTHHEREDDGNENGTKDVADGTTFVDRVLKEDSSQRTFEKGFLTTVHALIGTARDAQVNLAPWFSTMNLPTFEAELVPLISFPTRLVQAILRVRLDYAAKLRDPEVLIIDQIAEDLRVNIGLACTLKRQYEAFLAPDPGGNWNLPNCIADDYDGVVRDALTFFFELVHLKLKSGTKSIYFKETDILEGHWPTFNDVSLSTSGGSCLVAERLW